MSVGVSFPQLLYIRFGNFQPGVDDVHVFFRRGDAALALLLEAVKDEHGLSKLDGLHGAVGATNIDFHHLKHASTTTALEHFGRVVFVTRQRDKAKPKSRRTSAGKAIKSL